MVHSFVLLPEWELTHNISMRCRAQLGQIANDYQSSEYGPNTNMTCDLIHSVITTTHLNVQIYNKMMTSSQYNYD